MRRPIRLGAATAALAALALLATACGGGSQEEARTGAGLATTPAFNEQPYDNVRDGGTVTLPVRSEINPQFNQFQGDMTTDTRTVWNWYNPFVINFSPSGEPQINPDYVTEARPETVGGNTRVTFTINPRAVYNDGTPIDWRSFDATWKANNATNDAYIVNSSDGYDRVASVARGANDKQAVVTFRGLNAAWPAIFNNLLHPKALDPQVFNKGYLNNPHPEWGAGPYRLTAYDQQNSTVTFERNPGWWGKKGKLDKVTLVQLEPVAKINAFRNGQIDAAEAERAEDVNQARTTPGAEIRVSGLPGSFLMTLNSRSPLLVDPAVREAVMQGIDRKQIVDITFQGLNYSEDPLGSLVNKPFQPGYADNSAAPSDPAAAQQGLDAAGWAPGPDGVRTKGGQRLALTYVQTGDTPSKRAVSGALVAMMKNIGVDLTVRQVPSSEFNKIIANKEFDLLISGFRSTDPYGPATICQLYCSTSQLNNSGTGTAALDAELAAVPTKPTIEEQNAAANAVEKKALATFGLLPIYSGPEIWATKPGLANFGSGLFEKALPETIGWQK